MTAYYSRNGVEALRRGEAADPESYDVSGGTEARESFRGLRKGEAVGTLAEAETRAARIARVANDPEAFAAAFGLEIVGATATGFRTRRRRR